MIKKSAYLQEFLFSTDFTDGADVCGYSIR